MIKVAIALGTHMTSAPGRLRSSRCRSICICASSGENGSGEDCRAGDREERSAPPEIAGPMRSKAQVNTRKG